MKIKVLGCSGGIGGELRTTSFLVDDDILLDAGTGVGDLCMDELLAIDHVFITHSHLDHVAYLPFLVDTVMGTRTEPLTVHATQETWGALKNHLFNWNIWPDFNVIPNASTPVLRHNEIRIGEPVRLNGRTITALPAEHVVSAIGFWLDSGTASLVFSGDTTRCDAFWRADNSIGNLKYLIIETAFCNAESERADASKHLYPSLLLEQLNKLQHPAEIFITHLKPGAGEIIMREIDQCAACFSPRALSNLQLIEF